MKTPFYSGKNSTLKIIYLASRTYHCLKICSPCFHPMPFGIICHFGPCTQYNLRRPKQSAWKKNIEMYIQIYIYERSCFSVTTFKTIAVWIFNHKGLNDIVPTFKRVPLKNPNIYKDATGRNHANLGD